MGMAGWVAAAADLVLPATCASCGVPGPAVCPACLRDAWGWAYPGGPGRVRPDPEPPGLPPVVTAAVNDGAVRRLLHAYKDEDRRDVRPALVDLLVPALARATGGLRALDPRPEGSAGASVVLVVPVPTSRAARRRRGDAPLEDLVAQACRRVPGAVCAPLLRSRGRTTDQALLGAHDRATNLVGTMALAPGVAPQHLRGTPVVLADDLLTTGSTLVEAARALGRGGVPVAGAVVVAATRRRAPRRAEPPPRVGRRCPTR